MNGLGPFGNGGGSLSSSNLSPIAPPFTVNRSDDKPPLHFTDSPYAAPPYNQNWSYSQSSAPKQDFSTNSDPEIDATRTTFVPLPRDYQYASSDSINSQRTQWYAIRPSAEAVKESNYYPEPKQYYHPYVTNVVDDTPLVALNDPSYDSLSTSGVGPLDGSSQIDHTQNFSGMEYVPQWGGFWNGSNERKQGKQVEVNVNFCSEETYLGGSIPYKNYANQGSHTTDTMSKFDKGTPISHVKSYETLAGEKCSGSSVPWEFNVKPSLGQSFVPFESPKRPISGATSMNPPPEPFLRTSTNSSYGPYKKAVQPPVSSVNESFTNPSPAFILRPQPAGGTASPRLATVSSNSSHNFPKRQDLQVPFGFQRESSENIFALPTKKVLLNKPLIKDINIPNGFSSSIDSAEAVKFTGNSFDYHNSSVDSPLDSPCWKGAPSHFSSFESLPPQPLMKKFEASNGLNLQGGRIFTPFDDSIQMGPQEPRGASSQNELLNNKGVQFSDELDKQRNEHNVSEGNSVFKMSHFDGLIPEGGKGFASTKLNFHGGVLNSNNVSREGSTPFGTVENVSSSPYPEENEKLHGGGGGGGGGLKPKVDVEMLVDTIRNLSELLLIHCSNEANSLKKQDHEVIEHVIGNLDACVSKKMTHAQPDTSSEIKDLPDLHVSASGSRPEVTNEAVINPGGVLFDCKQINEEGISNNGFGEKVVKFTDFVPLKDDADVSKHNNLVQAIKKELDENFNGEDETHPQVLLYKNLWLEAEAELCSFTYKARFTRMMKEMDGRNSDKSKNLNEGTMVVEKHASLDDSDSDSDLTKSDGKDSPILKAAVHEDSITNNPADDDDDAEASIMARLNILKHRSDYANNPAVHEDSITNNPADGDAEASVMARINILKHRSDYLNTINVDGQQLPEMGAGFSDVSEKGKTKEYRICVDDDQISQTSGKILRPRNQFLSGWYDTSSSDWEHVWKDEFAWKN